MSENVQRPDRPDHENPWAMQLVVHRVKADPAHHEDVVEAAAQAVVQLLDDERSRTGEWAEQVEHWRAGWIRKVVRRADGARWDAVQSLPGVTVAHGTAQVRAFVPGPLQPLPKDLAKLQVGGTEFPRGGREDAPAAPAAPAVVAPTTPAAPAAFVEVEITPLEEISTGKTAAQAGHAAQLLYEQMGEGERATWRADGFRVRLLPSDEAAWEEPGDAVRVIDAGLTEVDGPTETARAHRHRALGE
ncbi:peptidyl-tRNA hydrolase [Brachybacterium halotolerans]